MSVRRMGLWWLVVLLLGLIVPAAASALTVTVDSTADTVTANGCAAGHAAGTCSLREAVIETNAVAGPNTINVPAGTYTLTRTAAGENQHTGPFDSQSGELDVESNTTISGASQASTIVQAGTTATNGIDVIFIVNGYQSISQAKQLNVTLQHMTMRFGFNRETDINGWGDGGAVEFDSTDGGTLTLNDDLITQNSTTNDPGGGVAVFNTALSKDSTGRSIYHSTASRTIIENSTITNNNAVQQNGGGGGGGVFDGSPEPITIQNSTITGNTATAAGGGVEAPGQALSTYLAGVPINTIQNTTISNNTATNDGGGFYNTVPFSVSGSTFSQNSTTSGALNGGGGGLFLANLPGETTSITTSTITGNSVTGSQTGGGILNSSGTLSLTFSRITGNHAPTRSGLDQPSNNVVSSITATNDWWGCDSGPGPAAGPANPGCDSATDENTTAGSTFTTAPWITLKTTATPTSIQYGTTSSLSTSFLQNSVGTALTAAQIPTQIGLPVTWSGVHGTISNVQTSIQSNGTATATFTAGSTSADCGTGSGQAKVDGVPTGETPATASITVLCPDFTVTSTNDVLGQTQLSNSGACPPQCWSWTDTVSNAGPGFGTFSDGQTILSDNLPSTHIAYGTPTETNLTGVTGTITCSVNATNDLTCQASGSVKINSGGSFKVALQATPSATGSYANPRASGACVVDPGNNVPETSDANNSCSNTVTVTGSDAAVTASPASNDFGPQLVGTASAVRTFTISNSGGAPLQIASAALTGSDAGEYTESSDGCTGKTIAPAGTCTVDVAFKPTSRGAHDNASLAIASNAATSPDQIALHGTGVQGAIAASPGSKDFGDQPVGTTSQGQTFTVTDTGTAPVQITTVSLVGQDKSEYSESADACSGKTIAPGGSCTVVVAFSPTSAGAHDSASLEISSNAPASPDDVPLRGTGTAAPVAGGTFGVLHVRVRRHGVVTFDARVPGPGRLTALETATASATAHASRAARHRRHGPLVFAQEQLSITASGTRHVTVKPSRAGRKLIAHHSRPVRITLSVTFKAASGKAQRKTVRGLLVAK